jgi:hypothetical protein
MRFVPYSALHEERQGERIGEPVGERPAAVQPAGYGMAGMEQDPAEIIAERDAVHHTLLQLPQALRQCLLLSVVGGLSAREIAKLLNLSEVAVRQRLARARKLFQRLYLLESGEAIADTSPLPSQVGARDAVYAPVQSPLAVAAEGA